MATRSHIIIQNEKTGKVEKVLYNHLESYIEYLGFKLIEKIVSDKYSVEFLTNPKNDYNFQFEDNMDEGLVANIEYLYVIKELNGKVVCMDCYDIYSIMNKSGKKWYMCLDSIEGKVIVYEGEGSKFNIVDNDLQAFRIEGEEGFDKAQTLINIFKEFPEKVGEVIKKIKIFK